jgi:hypothetical protein
MTNGTRLTIDTLRKSFDHLKFQMQALEDASDKELSPVVVKLCLECLAADATRFAGAARAGAAIEAAHLNRHTMIAAE